MTIAASAIGGDGGGIEPGMSGNAFQSDAGRGGLRRRRRASPPVQLDHVEHRLRAADFLDGGIYHHRDAQRAAAQRGEPRGRPPRCGHVASSPGKRLNPRASAPASMAAWASSRLVMPQIFTRMGAVHSMTLPFACFMPSSRVMTRMLIRPFSERMKALRIQLTKEMMRAPRKAWPKEST